MSDLPDKYEQDMLWLSQQDRTATFEQLEAFAGRVALKMQIPGMTEQRAREDALKGE
jgi:hypothetical protein